MTMPILSMMVTLPVPDRNLHLMNLPRILLTFHVDDDDSDLDSPDIDELGDPPPSPETFVLELDGESVRGETLDDLDDSDDVVGENVYPLKAVSSKGDFPALENDSGDEEVWRGNVRVRGEEEELSHGSDRTKRQRILFEDDCDWGEEEEIGS